MDNKEIQKAIIKSGLSTWELGKKTGMSPFAIWSFTRGEFKKVSKKNIAILDQWAMGQRSKTTIWGRIKEFFK